MNRNSAVAPSAEASDASDAPIRWGAWSLVAAAGGLFGAVLVLVAAWIFGWDLVRGPLAGTALLVDGEDRWIVYPLDPRTTARPEVLLEAIFEGEVEIPSGVAGDAAVLEVRMLGRGEVWVAGTSALSVGEEAGPGEVYRRRLGDLKPGLLRVRVRVEKADGPPALRLRLAGEGESRWVLHTNESWRVSLAGAEVRPARLAASSVRPDPGALRGKPVAGTAAWAAALPRLLLMLGLALVAVMLLERVRLPEVLTRHRSWVAVGGTVLLGLGLWMQLADRMPLTVGFDAAGHLEYIDHLQRHGALPAADAGWQMYHPPLFYALAAGLLEVFGLTVQDPAAALALRGFTTALGVAQIWLLWLAVVLGLQVLGLEILGGRRQPEVELAALLFAATLPVHLVLFRYVSNETLAVTLSGALAVAVLWALSGIPGGAPYRWRVVLVGAVLGLALLAKVTVVVLVPLVLLVLMGHRWRSGGHWLAGLVDAGLAAGVAAALSGWHYLRLARRFGNPLVGNWDPALGFRWWQDPGYRTPGDFLSFGGSLADPWFAGFDSVADGLWSTLWAGGLVGGQAVLRSGPPWHHPWMTVASGLALLPALVLFLGLALVVRRWWRRPRPVEGWLMGSVAILAAALVWMTLQVPSYAQAKAFYAQPALPALVILFAVGAAWLLGRGRWARRGFWVLLIVWSLVALHGVTGSQSEATLITAGRAFLQAGDPQRAEGCFDRALELKAKSPEVQAEAQVGRFWALLGQERRGEAEAALAAALELDPRHPEALLAQARRRASAGRWREAGELARSSLAETSKTGAPGELRAQLLLAEALVQQGRSAEAMTELQRALAGTPESRPVHRALVELALRRGEAATAARHLEMLRRLRPGDQELGALEERLRGLSSGQELP